MVFLFALILALRLPTYFEPYWYGDEAIYLTIGTGINQGETLYKDIVDHKTPIIYYLARVPDQLSFRVLLTGWMFVATGAFFYVAKELLGNKRIAWIASVVFVLATTLPTFEGMIPNGELFVLGFILPAVALLYRRIKDQPLEHYPSLNKQSLLRPKQLLKLATSTFGVTDKVWLIGVGALLGLAILTKVPAGFDVGAIYLLLLFVTLKKKSKEHSLDRKLAKALQFCSQALWLTLGVLTPIILSFMYFGLLGAFRDYIQFGLLYNFHYTGTWAPESTLPLVSLFYSLKGKFLLLGAGTALVLAATKYLKPLTAFSAVWVWWALIAASLSNRPYAHYFIQVMPALVLCCFVFGQEMYILFRKRTHSAKRFLAVHAIVIFLTFLFVGYVDGAVHVTANRYDMFSYYGRYWKALTGQTSKIAFEDSFNELIADNRLAAQVIDSEHPEQIYIWGTNPMLYAQTHTTPPDKFTVLFHVADLNVYDQTILNVIHGNPSFIVVMKDAEKPPVSLERYINNNYVPVFNLEYMNVWHRRALP